MNMSIIAASRLRVTDIRLFGSISGVNKYAGGVLAPNGKIYCIPADAEQVLEIDPSNNTTNLFGNIIGVNKYAGGVLASNGKIYCIPAGAGAEQVLEIDPSNNTTNLFGNISGSAKYTGGVLAPNGKIYGISWSSSEILEISGVSSPNVIGSDANIPASLSNLASSNYNKFYNKL